MALHIWIDGGSITVQEPGGVTYRVSKPRLLSIIERATQRFPDVTPEDFIYTNLQEMGDSDSDP